MLIKEMWLFKKSILKRGFIKLVVQWNIEMVDRASKIEHIYPKLWFKLVYK